MNEELIIVVSQAFWLAFLISLIMALFVLRNVLRARRLAREKARPKDNATLRKSDGTTPDA